MMLPWDLGQGSLFGEDGVDLANRERQALCRAHGKNLFHCLRAREHTLERHARTPAADFLNAHARGDQRQVVVGRAGWVREPVTEHESMWCMDLDDLPVAVMLVALGPRHVVLDAAAGYELVSGECGGVVRWAPPALPLARIGPELPDALR